MLPHIMVLGDSRGDPGMLPHGQGLVCPGAWGGSGNPKHPPPGALGPGAAATGLSHPQPGQPGAPNHHSQALRAWGRMFGFGVTPLGMEPWHLQRFQLRHPPPRVFLQGHHVLRRTGSSYTQFGMYQSLEPPGLQPMGYGKCNLVGSDAGKAAGCGASSAGSAGSGKGPASGSASR